MTIYTIAYNNYGVFIDKWLEGVKTNNPSEIIVVLGKEHNILTRRDGVKYIESDSDCMGTLRNLALKEATSDWVLYFSVDDVLLPNAIEEISKHKDHDAVALRFFNKTINRETPMQSAIITDPLNWRKSSVPGYIAHKRLFKGELTTYEDIEIPNYPFLFKLFKKGFKICLTDTEVALYVRRKNSHGDKAFKNSQWLRYARTIDQYAIKYTEQ